jgi:GT2 family glycosyltransferase
MISIVIPNYNGLEHLKTCYQSLKNQTVQDFVLILVDNGSGDDSVAYTKSFFESAVVIELGYNSGFAKAVNEGVKYSRTNLKSEYILLLNNDIELTNDFLERALSGIEKYTDASMAAVKMLYYYDRSVIDDCGDFIKRNGGSPMARGHGEKDTGQYDKEEYIFGACAGAALYKAEIFDNAGYFDESFFAYYEDIDFSFRCQLQGYKCIYLPRAVCYHKRGGTSSVATHGFQTEMCERNLVLMRYRNYPLSIYILYQPLFFVARLKRYYSFVRYYSVSLMFRAFRGYLRGQIALLKKLPDRFKIQKKRTVSVSYIKGLFLK